MGSYISIMEDLQARLYYVPEMVTLKHNNESIKLAPERDVGQNCRLRQEWIIKKSIRNWITKESQKTHT